MYCKDCKYFDNVDFGKGFCQKYKDSVPFLIVDADMKCVLTRTKLKCKNCKYWKLAKQNDEIVDNFHQIGACTYKGAAFPMFAEEFCALNDVELKIVEKENSGI